MDSILVKVYSPNNEVELAFIKSLLESEHIPFFVHNDYFGSLRVGFILQLFNERNIYIDKKYEKYARYLIQDFLDSIRTEPEKDSLTERIRMFFEAILLGWVIPGKRWNQGFPKEDLMPVIVASAIFVIVFSTSSWLIIKISDYFHHYFKYKFYY